MYFFFLYSYCIMNQVSHSVFKVVESLEGMSHYGSKMGRELDFMLTTKH